MRPPVRFASKDPFPAAQPSCAAPDLAGTVVDVTLTDGGPMQPSVTGPATTRRGVIAPGATWPTAGGNSDRVARRSGYPSPGMGTMRILVNRATVPAGMVSLQVLNTGMLPHRVVVLPLAQGRFPDSVSVVSTAGRRVRQSTRSRAHVRR